jgi:hypothetical protein
LSLDDLERLATSFLQDEKTNWMTEKSILFVTWHEFYVVKLWCYISGFVLLFNHEQQQGLLCKVWRLWWIISFSMEFLLWIKCLSDTLIDNVLLGSKIPWILCKELEDLYRELHESWGNAVIAKWVLKVYFF